MKWVYQIKELHAPSTCTVTSNISRYRVDNKVKALNTHVKEGIDGWVDEPVGGQAKEDRYEKEVK